MPTSQVEPSHAVADAVNADPVFQVEEVTAGYGRVPIIKKVSVSARPGEITAIVGPNGAGKSTLLKAAMGILKVTEGTVRLRGEDVRNLQPHELARRGVGYVPQVRDVFEPLSVAENLEMGGYLVPRAEVPARMEEVFAIFPVLAERRRQRASNLSGGERKMLAIGRVIMSSPNVLLLDEPTANLSPKIADSILREHVTKLAALGVAILLVEQRAIQALTIAHRACVMVNGSVAVSGTPEELGPREEIARVFLRG